MALLNAALAFAITMLVLSMVTSVFVETIQRFVGPISIAMPPPPPTRSPSFST
jgi:hypothetical protein